MQAMLTHNMFHYTTETEKIQLEVAAMDARKILKKIGSSCIFVKTRQSWRLELTKETAKDTINLVCLRRFYMNWMNKMERKFGKYAVQNLTVILLVCYGTGFVINMVYPQLLSYLTLEPGLILQGQVWRLISWIIIPPTGSILAFLFVLLLYYSLGRTLETVWGAFRYNVYIFSGIIFTIIGAFVVYAVTGGAVGYGSAFSTYYLNLSIFLACAAIMPNLELWIYGIIPVKMKWLAILDVVLLLPSLLYGNLAVRTAVVASLLNFLIFFLFNRNLQKFSPKQAARRQKFKRQVKRPENHYPGGAKHRCAVCGRTELDDSNLEFRYCSKCRGNYEYCQDHLFTHQHVK